MIRNTPGERIKAVAEVRQHVRLAVEILPEVEAVKQCGPEVRELFIRHFQNANIPSPDPMGALEYAGSAAGSDEAYQSRYRQPARPAGMREPLPCNNLLEDAVYQLREIRAEEAAVAQSLAAEEAAAPPDADMLALLQEMREARESSPTSPGPADSPIRPLAGGPRGVPPAGEPAGVAPAAGTWAVPPAGEENQSLSKQLSRNVTTVIDGRCYTKPNQTCVLNAS